MIVFIFVEHQVFEKQIRIQKTARSPASASLSLHLLPGPFKAVATCSQLLMLFKLESERDEDAKKIVIGK